MDVLTDNLKDNITNTITDNLLIDYNEYSDATWNNILNSISHIPTLNIESLHDSNNLNTSRKEKKQKKNSCTINKCNLKYYKENLCRQHYNKSHNLLCSIEKCNNLKRKNDLCYKHMRPLCCIMRCKCHAITNEVLCKKHKKFKIELHTTNVL